MNAGSQSATARKIMTIASRNKSAQKNGAIPLKIVMRGTSGNIDFRMNTFSPIGGNGESGIGREGTEADIDAMTEWKWITIQS
jgi:acyl-CoA reductase-like NAD-dependent aldehyde dehydrogenase